MTRRMKDNGIEWIGEIPKEWSITKIGSIYQERNTKVSDEDYPPLSVTKNGILPQLDSAAKTDNGDNRKLVEIDDFVINSRSDRRGSCGISQYEGSVSLINTVLEPKKDINNLFYNYVFKSENFADEFYRWGNGIVDDLWSTKWTNMKKIYIPYPVLKKQTQIANYLDSKCYKINETIEKQKQVIEKLKEYKQSVITEAVTKGLNPDVKMKDCGIEWIGEIPEYWKIYRLKNLLAMPLQYGANDSGEEFNENEPRYIRITDITMDNKLTDENKLSLPLDRAKPYILENGDILFARSGATVGKSFIYKKEFGLSAFAGYLIRAKFNEKVLPKFIFYYTLSNSYIEWKNRIFIQATIQNIGANKYSNMEITLPLVKEQKEIIEYLDNKCSKIDNIIAQKESLIEKLTEYKKSLIYECVTGKREV